MVHGGVAKSFSCQTLFSLPIKRICNLYCSIITKAFWSGVESNTIVIFPYEALGAHLWHVRHTHTKAYICADINTNEPSICSGSCDDFNVNKQLQKLLKHLWIIFKHFWYTFETLVKKLYNHWCHTGEKLVIHWSDTCETQVK